MDHLAPAAEPGVEPELQQACVPYIVAKQVVEIEVNLRERSIHGVVHLTIFPTPPVFGDIDVHIDARQFEIDTKKILVNGHRTVASYTDPLDVLDIPTEWTVGASQHHLAKKRIKPLLPERNPAAELPSSVRDSVPSQILGLGCTPANKSIKVSIRPADFSDDVDGKVVKMLEDPDWDDDCRIITIPFRSKHIRDGLQFVGVEEGDPRYPHVYTRHSNEPGTASCIFPCIDDPGMRNNWRLYIKIPRTLGDALEQPLATQQAAPNGLGSLNGSRKRKTGESPHQSKTVLLEEDKLLEMTVICSGNLVGEQVDPEDDSKKIMSFWCHGAARHIGFAIGPFEHVPLWDEFRTEELDEKLGVLAAKMHGYCLPGRVDELRNTCAPLVYALDHFTLEYGKYPFEGGYKMCFVDDMVHDTAEVVGLSFCSTRMLYPEEIIEKDIEVTRLLVHSLAAQYFGVLIIPDRRTDTWIIVAIQWYITDLFMKNLCGNNWYRFHLKKLANQVVKLDVGRPSIHDIGEYLHVGDFEMEFLSLKAPLVLFTLDQRMSKYPGSIGVGRVISHLVSNANISPMESMSTTLSADAFRDNCSKKTQYKLDEFWQQWVKGAGCPKFLIKAKFNKKNLNVDITVSQTQADPLFPAEKRLLEKEDFWREFQEEIHAVYAGTVAKAFTGPITVRIHEADGTPYEHYLDIREGDKNGHLWVIPYNTKYKRLKRKSRREAGAAAGGAAIDDGGNVREEDIIYFNMLGDVLQSEEDVRNWGLQDWDPDTQTQMDQESYEWIRFDCNFEWVADIITDMPMYMYLAQLQQDRDVVAHEDALNYFKRIKPSAIGSAIETRTVIDRRYYHGVRTMAVEDIPKYAIPQLNHIGEAHLILAFRKFFCYQTSNKTYQPNPNDFTDKAQYAVQTTMLNSIARIRKERGRCSVKARSFLLDLLLFNNNDTNEYSDQFYIASLLKALTVSLIPASNEEDKAYILTLKEDDDEDVEFKNFIGKVIEEIDRFRRMDEWTGSYQNVWTTTALECKKMLMKERVIPMAPLEYLQYLQDDNIDLVRVKAFECLVELGMLARKSILKFLLAAMSTDNSAFVRDRLFKIFCSGIASIALGEQAVDEKKAAPVIEDESGLIIEQAEAITDARKEKAARREDIQNALKALKEDLKGNAVLQRAIWKAFQSHVLGVDEKLRILDMCEALFEPEDTLLVTVKYPTYWKCQRVPNPNPKPVVAGVAVAKPKKEAWLQFTLHYRTEPKKKPVVPQLPPTVPVMPALGSFAPPPVAASPSVAVPFAGPSPVLQDLRPPETKKIKIQSRGSFAGSPGSGPGAGFSPTTSGSVPPSVPQQSPAPVMREPTALPRQPSVLIRPGQPSSAERASTPTVVRVGSSALNRPKSPIIQAPSPAMRNPAISIARPGQISSPRHSPAPSPRPSPKPSPMSSPKPSPKLPSSSSFGNSVSAPRPAAQTPKLSAASPPPPTPAARQPLPTAGTPRQPLPTSARDSLSVPKASSTSKLPGKENSKKRKSEAGEVNDRPVKKITANNSSRPDAGPAKPAPPPTRQKLITCKFTKWTRLRGESSRKIMAAATAAPKPVSTPMQPKKPLGDSQSQSQSASPSVNGSAALPPPPPSSGRHPLPGSGNGQAKVRKPLPGGPAREKEKPTPPTGRTALPGSGGGGSARAGSASGGGGSGGGDGSAAPKPAGGGGMKIKLKLKGAGSRPSPAS